MLSPAPHSAINLRDEIRHLDWLSEDFNAEFEEDSGWPELVAISAMPKGRIHKLVDRHMFLQAFFGDVRSARR